MGIKIIEEECTSCGICKIQCHLDVIKIKPNGKYEIDELLCDGCDGLLDIGCAKVCKPGCIIDYFTREPIKISIPEPIRLRPDTLLSIVAIMGTGNSGRYNSRKELETERFIIARIAMEPAINLQIIGENSKTAEILGFEFGQIINFWDAVSIARQKITPEYLKAIGKPDTFIEDFINSISPYKTMENGLPT